MYLGTIKYHYYITLQIAQRLYCEGEKALNKAYLLENHLEQQFHILKRQQCQLKENEKRIVMVS